MTVRTWRSTVAFTVALTVDLIGAGAAHAAPQAVSQAELHNTITTLVGFGTRMANGCTSGHGVCGLPRFSMRSMAATGIFMATAMLTVFVTRHML